MRKNELKMKVCLKKKKKNARKKKKIKNNRGTIRRREESERVSIISMPVWYMHAENFSFTSHFIIPSLLCAILSLSNAFHEY